ncbi:hypothetical protein GNF76_27175 [Pseudomonas sp. CCM 7893]|uniref:Uncharacterized protein n=1 Tax=Pseudomonas spelaei TaxID=1055469 RepID=A0A6I3WBD2_9PSED|nr:hypothetical protein [Pseudomonas spelaei]MUF08030.1 hypothetical protein [Pseudomonas spelaei]
MSLNTADQTIDDLKAAVSRRTKRVRDLEAQLAYAADALNEVVKASAMYEKPFEIATLAIGEMSAGIEQPAPVAVASRAEPIAWLKRIDGIGQNRAELIYSMNFRLVLDPTKS